MMTVGVTARTDRTPAITGGDPRSLVLWVLRAILLVHLYAVVWTVALAILLVPLGFRPVVVASASMTPTFGAGDLLFVDESHGEIQPGAVVTFHAVGEPSRLVTHRVVGFAGPDELVTKGDANATVDSTPVAFDDVVGVSKFSIPLVGHPVLWLQSGGWLPLSLWLIFTMTSLTIVFGRRPVDAAPRGLRVPRIRVTNRSLGFLLASELVAISVLLLNLLAT